MSAIEALRAELRKHETKNNITHASLPFGVPEIDNRLPDSGISLGAFHEVSGAGNGAKHGAAAALFAAGIMARTEGPVLWCVKHRDLFALALCQAGLDIDRIIFVEVWDEVSRLKCFEEGLRHTGVAGVVAEISTLSMTASRRLQLAAEEGGTIGIAIWRWHKSEEAMRWEQPTAARTRWRISAVSTEALPVQGVDRAQWNLELMRCRGGERANFTVKACDEKGHIIISAPLANRPVETQEARSWAIAQ